MDISNRRDYVVLLLCSSVSIKRKPCFNSAENNFFIAGLVITFCNYLRKILMVMRRNKGIV